MGSAFLVGIILLLMVMLYMVKRQLDRQVEETEAEQEKSRLRKERLDFYQSAYEKGLPEKDKFRAEIKQLISDKGLLRTQLSQVQQKYEQLREAHAEVERTSSARIDASVCVDFAADMQKQASQLLDRTIRLNRFLNGEETPDRALQVILPEPAATLPGNTELRDQLDQLAMEALARQTKMEKSGEVIREIAGTLLKLGWLVDDNQVEIFKQRVKDPYDALYIMRNIVDNVVRDLGSPVQEVIDDPNKWEGVGPAESKAIAAVDQFTREVMQEDSVGSAVFKACQQDEERENPRRISEAEKREKMAQFLGEASDDTPFSSEDVKAALEIVRKDMENSPTKHCKTFAEIQDKSLTCLEKYVGQPVTEEMTQSDLRESLNTVDSRC